MTEVPLTVTALAGEVKEGEAGGVTGTDPLVKVQYADRVDPAEFTAATAHLY